MFCKYILLKQKLWLDVIPHLMLLLIMLVTVHRAQITASHLTHTLECSHWSYLAERTLLQTVKLCATLHALPTTVIAKHTCLHIGVVLHAQPTTASAVWHVFNKEVHTGYTTV